MLFLALLVFAPLNYGSTRVSTFHTLVALTALASLLWLGSAWAARSFAKPPRIVMVGAVLVGLAAIASLILPDPNVPGFTVQHFARVITRWPFSVMSRNELWLILWAAAGVAALFALYDLAREPAWRVRLAVTIVIAGVAVALLGLAQNATGARGIYWDGSLRMPGAFFGPFFHHTSAGAFLNSTWPLGLGLAFLGMHDRTARAAARGSIQARSPAGSEWRILALLGTALVLGAHVGHVSRFPQVIALGALIAFGLWLQPWRRSNNYRSLRVVLTATMATVIVAVFVLGAGRIDEIRARWNRINWSQIAGGDEKVPPLPSDQWARKMRDDLFIPSDHRGYPLGDRGAAYATAIDAIADRPLFGWGPGGWTAAAAANSFDPFIRTFFLMLQFTHQDYLQVCVEWGLLGALGWALLIPAGVFFALRHLGFQPARDPIGAGATVALLTVLTQSLIDFPMQIPAVQFNAIALAALAWSVPRTGEASSLDPTTFVS